MIDDFQEKHKQQGAKVRSIMDYTMGIVFFCLGLFFIVYRHFGIRIMGREPSMMDYFIGGLFILYGSWRIYRGYKKTYYR
jgi:hypothetical protein